MSEAKKCLRSLVEHVFNHPDGLITTLTYKDLARKISRFDKNGNPHAHGMGDVLGKMGHILGDLSTEWAGEEIPHIQSLVVNKGYPLKGLPDVGIKEFWPEYPSLSKNEKASKARTEHQKILNFGSRWNEVLKSAGLDPVLRIREGKAIHDRKYGSGGESPEHKKLKHYVFSNGAKFGALGPNWNAVEEYALPSLDSIDVLFKSPNRWISVEVKSSVSDRFPGDYERGVYQAVKYRAIIQAMTKDINYRAPFEIETLLVLESKLPSYLKGPSPFCVGNHPL